MKREILLSLGILFCVNSFAQNIKIENQRVIERDDKVYVTFTLMAEKIKSNNRLVLTPVLYNGDKSKSLKPIVIAGRNRTIIDKRQLAPIALRTGKNQRIPYNITVSYEDWMSDISLRIDRKVESCCAEQVLSSQTIVQDRPIRYDVILPKIELINVELSPLKQMDIDLPFLAPISEYAAFKQHTDVMRAKGALIVRFGQGRNIIDPSYEDNAKSLEQIAKVLELIAEDTNASVGKIVLAGTSSPEGLAKFNDLLAQKRVQALRDYLNETTRMDIHLVESINVGEDWVGLRQMVEESDMQYKNEVLHIINTVSVMQDREKQLMNLKWGRPYTYMMEHFFPKLRNAGYIRIFYELTPDMEFEKANQAIELCNNKEYLDALTRLDGVKRTATTEYVSGVCYMMLGEYDKAEASLNRAIKLGNTEAPIHLQQIQRLRMVKP